MGLVTPPTAPPEEGEHLCAVSGVGFLSFSLDYQGGYDPLTPNPRGQESLLKNCAIEMQGVPRGTSSSPCWLFPESQHCS